MSVETCLFHAIDATFRLGVTQSKLYLYPLCTATTPKVISLTVGDLNPAMASCDNNSSCDGCFLMDSTN